MHIFHECLLNCSFEYRGNKQLHRHKIHKGGIITKLKIREKCRPAVQSYSISIVQVLFIFSHNLIFKHFNNRVQQDDLVGWLLPDEAKADKSIQSSFVLSNVVNSLQRFPNLVNLSNRVFGLTNNQQKKTGDYNHNDELSLCVTLVSCNKMPSEINSSPGVHSFDPDKTML